MKLKNLNFLLAAALCLVAANSFIIVANNSIGGELFKDNVKSFSQFENTNQFFDLNQGQGGPTGKKYKKEYDCKGNSVSIELTKTVDDGKIVEYEAKASGQVGFSKKINVSGGFDYKNKNNDKLVTKKLGSLNVALNDKFFGKACDCSNDDVCDIWDPCPYYLAHRATEMIKQKFGIDFADFGYQKE